MTPTRTVAALVATLVFAGCDDPAGPADALALNRERWRAQGLEQYEFVFRRACYCPVEAVGPVQIGVAAGVVTSVIDTLGAPVDSLDVARYFSITIDSLFGVVERAIAVHAHQLAVRYHPDLGYPESIVVDYDAATVDEEMGLSAALLVPFSGSARHRAHR